MENNIENESYKKLKKLIELAVLNTGESWDAIDEELPQCANDESFLNWARLNLNNENSGLRDLSATVLEKSNCNLVDENIKNLEVLMNEDDENPYPSFRAACALASRYPDKRIKAIDNEILARLNEFISDTSVGDIAKKYINKIKPK